MTITIEASVKRMLNGTDGSPFPVGVKVPLDIGSEFKRGGSIVILKSRAIVHFIAKCYEFGFVANGDYSTVSDLIDACKGIFPADAVTIIGILVLVNALCRHIENAFLGIFLHAMLGAIEVKHIIVIPLRCTFSFYHHTPQGLEIGKCATTQIPHR